ncbi:MAG: Gfo/Idh/MocA family oxidoreductase [Oscillospiraceae bacterium]|jgi:predicted dehydrogenase|nr:Gfo/Idh/MocA family oxidoreductase [Oscillospiraceae bacterium]
MKKQLNVAIIGCGAISGIYLENITKTFRDVRLLGVCDLIRERAEKAQEKYAVPKLYETMHDAFADPEVDIILNLTRPYEHFDVTSGALLAGKHVYTEKPLGATFDEGEKLTKLANEKGRRICGAPDTFLGAGIQTCRKAIDDGWIGTPIGAAAFMICHGHETWHPDPAFYYQFGGGPMLDMGPYYITALINLLGEIKGITGVTKSFFSERTITSKEHFGEVVKVECPTSYVGILHFTSGAVGTLHTTFDVHYTTQARLEIYGTAGTLICPDPNTFGGPVTLIRPENKAPQELPLLFDYKENSRALGLDDMAASILAGRDSRADNQQLLHALDVMTSFERSNEAGAYVPLRTTYERREAMRSGRPAGVL